MFAGVINTLKDHPLLTITLVLLICSCSDGSTRRSSIPRTEPAESPVSGGTEGTAPGRPGTGPVHDGDRDRTTSTPDLVPTTSESPLPTSAESREQPASIDIFAVMLGAGFILESDRDLADYLPVPPGATGQVGQFHRGADSLSIALVTYPAEIFADPHESWIRERMAVIPDSHERVVRLGATVIHIVAQTDTVADEVFQLFSNQTPPFQNGTPEAAP